MSSAVSADPAHGGDRVLDALLVAAGGGLGAGARYALGLALPDDPIAVAVVVANLVGACLLGVVAGAVSGRRAGLFLGTGVLGAFTTFSAITVEAALLPPATATVYLLGQLGAGVGLAHVGLWLGRRVRGPVVRGPAGGSAG